MQLVRLGKPASLRSHCANNLKFRHVSSVMNKLREKFRLFLSFSEYFQWQKEYAEHRKSELLEAPCVMPQQLSHLVLADRRQPGSYTPPVWAPVRAARAFHARA